MEQAVVLVVGPQQIRSTTKDRRCFATALVKQKNVHQIGIRPLHIGYKNSFMNSLSRVCCIFLSENCLHWVKTDSSSLSLGPWIDAVIFDAGGLFLQVVECALLGENCTSYPKKRESSTWSTLVEKDSHFKAFICCVVHLVTATTAKPISNVNREVFCFLHSFSFTLTTEAI